MNESALPSGIEACEFIYYIRCYKDFKLILTSLHLHLFLLFLFLFRTISKSTLKVAEVSRKKKLTSAIFFWREFCNNNKNHNLLAHTYTCHGNNFLLPLLHCIILVLSTCYGNKRYENFALRDITFFILPSKRYSMKVPRVIESCLIFYRHLKALQRQCRFHI